MRECETRSLSAAGYLPMSEIGRGGLHGPVAWSHAPMRRAGGDEPRDVVEAVVYADRTRCDRHADGSETWWTPLDAWWADHVRPRVVRAVQCSGCTLWLSAEVQRGELVVCPTCGVRS